MGLNATGRSFQAGQPWISGSTKYLADEISRSKVTESTQGWNLTVLLLCTWILTLEV